MIEARGKWTVGAGYVGPEGSPAACECPFRNANNRAPLGALIGRIGDGPIFLIGHTRTLQAPRSGELFLGSNDNVRNCTGDGPGSCYEDN